MTPTETPRPYCGFRWREGDETLECNMPWPHPGYPDREHEVVPRTQIFVAVDIAAEGPDAMTILERNFTEGVWTWRVISPASDDDFTEFTAIRERLRRTFEEEGPIDPLDTAIGEAESGDVASG